MKLFVYGTLKRQCSNNSFFHYSQYVDEVMTQGEMYDTGPYPVLIDNVFQATTSDTIFGELWEVAIEDFLRITRMELTSGYRLSMITVIHPNGMDERVYAYVFPRELFTSINATQPTRRITNWTERSEGEQHV